MAQRRARPRAQPAVHGGAAAALGELPRADLRLDRRSSPRTARSTGRSSTSACPQPNIGYTNTAMWLVFSYIWLPFMIIPVYTALERIPDSLIEASGDLGARELRTLPQRRAAARAARDRRGLDLHVLAHARRLHHAAAHRGDELEPHRQRDLRQHRDREQPPVRGRARDRPDRDHDDLPARRAWRSARSRRCRCDGRGDDATERARSCGWSPCCCSSSSRSSTIVHLRVRPLERPELADPPLHDAAGSRSPGTTSRSAPR